MRVGEGRAVAEKLRHDTSAPARRRHRTAPTASPAALGEPVRQRLAARPRPRRGPAAWRDGSVTSWSMAAPARGLAALVQPERRGPSRRSTGPRRRGRRPARGWSPWCRPRCRRHRPCVVGGVRRPRPTEPTPPAWASIRPAATGVPATQAEILGGGLASGRRRARFRGSTISVPMRAKPSSARSPRPIARK